MEWSFRAAALALATCLALVAACNREQAAAPPPAVAPAPTPAPPVAQEFRISRIDLGNAIDAAKRVSSPADVFKPGDTIYASIVTDGASPSVTLVARWTYEDGQTVSQDSQNVAPTGPAATEFHISKPDGWPAGRYQIELIANGASAGVRSFEVKE
jgi:hypothetical protein